MRRSRDVALLGALCLLVGFVWGTLAAPRVRPQSVAVAGADGRVVVIQLYDDQSWEYAGGVVATPSSDATHTPSVTPSAISTLTPGIIPTISYTPSLTVTPSAIPDTPTPTQESTIAPITPAPPPDPPDSALCVAGVVTSALNVRADHSTASAVVGKLTQSQRVEIDSLYIVHPEGDPQRTEWGRIPNGGWIALWYQGAELARLDDSAPCWELPIEDENARPRSLFGLHLIFTAPGSVVDVPNLGMLKGTDGTEWIMRAASIKRPDVLLVWRNLSVTGFGWRDCPLGWGQGDGAAVADAWWHAQYTTWEQRGLLGVIDYFEVVNECGYGGAAWEQAFWLRILDDARLAGVCVALFSDSYGTPEIAEFAARRPILEAMLEQECAPGRRPAVAIHIYEGVDGGIWKFGRWRLFIMLAGLKFEQLPWLVTEFGYANGTGPADCGAFWGDWTRAEKEFAAHPEIWAAANYSVGEGTSWTDLAGCLR